MKDVKVKLRTKFILSITIVVLLFGSINIILIRKITLESLQSELEKRGVFIAQNLGEHVIEYLLHEDFLSVQKLVDEIKVLDKDVAYTFIISSDEKVITHNFNQTFPVELIKANLLSEEKEYNVKLIFDKNKRFLYRDIAVPILNGELGMVRVGLAEKNITYQINKATTIFTGMVIVFFLAGIFGAFVFAYLITSPISKIVDGFAKLDLDKTAEEIRIKTHDEIEYLADKFNEMARRLQSTHNELKNAQTKLIQTEKLASIGTLVSGLAHEINNPLSGLKNCLNRIKKKPEKKETLKYLDLMLNALDKIEYVVKGLLDFSRTKSDIFSPVSVKEVIEKAFSLVGYKLEKHSIEVIKDIKNNIGSLMGEPHKLEQVFVNLILNSIDAMPDGGKLIVEAFNNNNKICIFVEDTGKGIPEAYLNKIFDPFFTTKETGKGTGLGLPISFNFIKAHGGEIFVESKQGIGTIMKVWLPSHSSGKTNRREK